MLRNTGDRPLSFSFFHFILKTPDCGNPPPLILMAFLIESSIATDKWPSLLGRSGLCSAVVNGKGGKLMAFLIEAQIPTDKWPSLLGRVFGLWRP